MALSTLVSAETATLYLLNGTVVRGEIVDRSAKTILLKTASGMVKLKTSRLMLISRQQLKLPAEVDKDSENTPEMDAVLAQMEKVLAENEALKKEIARLKGDITPAVPAGAPGSPAVRPKTQP